MKIIPGDICSYQRTNRTWGYFLVLRIDETDLGTVFSLKKFDVSSNSEITSQETDLIRELLTFPLGGHFPVSEVRVKEANPKAISRKDIVESDLDGYKIWKEAFDKGSAGVFDIPIEQI